MEDVLIVAIVFGFGAFVCTGIYRLIMAKINRTHGRDRDIDSKTFEQLAEAFIQHKKEMNRRVQNIEAIIADDEHLPTPEIEIGTEESESYNEGRLKNDLKNKN